jgi:hypothetical protein
MPTSPAWALVECGSWDCPDASYTQAFRVEPFDPQRHLAQGGWTLPAITLFDDAADVSHLRDLIVN